MSFCCLLECCLYGEGECLSVVFLGAVYMERGMSCYCLPGCCLYGEGDVFLLSWVLFIWRGGCLSVVLGAVYMEGDVFQLS